MKGKATIAMAAAVALLVSLSGVASAAKVQTRTSDFDGGTEVTVEPHGANCGFQMKGVSVGATWSSLWGDAALLHAQTINHYATMTGVALSIDGRIVALEQQSITDHDHIGTGVHLAGRSTAQFKTTLPVLRDVATARTAMIRISTPTGYEECYIVKGGSPKGSKALDALQRFLAHVDAQKATLPP